MPKLNKKPEASDRKVIYDKKRVDLCFEGEEGIGAITAQQAKDLLGWETEQDFVARKTEGMDEKQKAKASVNFGDDYLLKDGEGNKVRCYNNDHNRPFTESWAKTLCQDILNKNWKFNMENIIIGATGLVLSGQHRLIALILAVQEWMSERYKYHWEEKWPTEPVLESTVAFGANESQETTRTLDNVKPRTLSDVIFCDAEIFGPKVTNSERLKLGKMMDFAIKFMWHRTGADNDAFAPRRTHSEALDYIMRHKRIKETVKFIHDEYSANWKMHAERLSPGYAAGLMYLMGASGTNLQEYQNADPPSEKKVKWDKWDRAKQFWAELCKGSAALRPVIDAIGGLANEETGTGGTWKQKVAIMAKAWGEYGNNHRINAEDLELKYELDEEGKAISLDECPTVGGIDLGDYVEPPEVVTEEPINGKKNEEAPPVKEPANPREAAIKEKEKEVAEMKNKNGKAKGKATPSGEAKEEPKAKETPKPKEQVKPKKQTRNRVQEENTRRAKEADEALEAERAAEEDAEAEAEAVEA